MDWFNELIGFLVVLLVFLFPLLRKFMLARQKKRPLQEGEEEQTQKHEVEYEEGLSAYAKPSTSKPYTTNRLVKKDLEFHTNIESRKLESAIEERRLEPKVAPKFKERVISQAFIVTPEEEEKRKVRPITSITQRYTTLQTMVILSEILGRPKGFGE